MLRKFATLTLILGLAGVGSATYSTASPVRFISAKETCPSGCICVTSDDADGLMEVVCPTDETANMIDHDPPRDINPEDVVDVEAFMDTKPEKNEKFSLSEDSSEATPVSPSPSPAPPAESEKEADVPLVFPSDVEEEIPAKSKKIDIVDEEHFTLQPDAIDDEEMLGDQPADESDEFDATASPTFAPDVEVKPTEVAKVEPSPSDDTSQEEGALKNMSYEDSEEVVASEVTASLRPLVATTPEPPLVLPSDTAPVENEVESEEEEESATSAPLTPDVPLVFNDTEADVPVIKLNETEPVEAIEDVLQPDVEGEASSSPLPPIAPKVLVDVESNQVDGSLTSEDLVLGSGGEMSDKIKSADSPTVSEAPQQSTASWVILGLILAMFVGVLLYAAIKGRMDGGPEAATKTVTIGSAVAASSEFISSKNRRPSDEGTEMKEMSRALLGSPLEDRCSRFIDEEDEETIKRLIQQEEQDEILEQIIVEPNDLRPENNALEKPSRKFMHVPPPMVPELQISVPSTPTLVRAKLVDMPSEVHHVANGNAAAATSSEE